MDRRDFLKTTGAAAIAATGLATAAKAARVADRTAADHAATAAPGLVRSTRTLRLVSPWHDDVSPIGDHVRRLARRIETAMDGRWHIEAIANAGSGLEAVMTGDADLYIASENDHVGFHPAFAFFAGLPAATGLDASGLQAWLLTAGGQELWDALGGQFNIKSLLAGHTGAAPGLWSHAPLAAPGDLAGKRIAVSGLSREVARGLGAEPVSMPAGRIAAAFAAREIDIAEAPDASLATRRTLAAAAPYGTSSEFALDGAAISLGMRASFWDGLTGSERIVLSALASEAFASALAEQTADLAMTADIKSHAPSQVPTLELLAQDISLATAKIAETVVAQMAGHDALSRRIDHSYMAFRSLTGRREPVAIG